MKETPETPRKWEDMNDEEKANAASQALMQLPTRLLDLTIAMNALAASNQALADSVMELVGEEDDSDAPDHL